MKKPFKPYIVIYVRAGNPNDHIAFEVGARNSRKAKKCADHMAKEDKEISKLGLLIHRVTLRILGEYSTDLGGEGLALEDTEELAEVSFEEVTRMCDMWIIDNNTLKRVSAEAVVAPINRAAAKDNDDDPFDWRLPKGTKPATSAATTTKTYKNYDDPFTAAVLAQCAQKQFTYSNYERKEKVANG